jgi:uncharacterized protein
VSDFVTTDDGTITKLDAETGELYHNRAGAYTEALCNYVQPSNALARLQENEEIKLLDSCFGLGYNTLALCAEAAKLQIPGKIVITAIELDPQIIRDVQQVMAAQQFATLHRFFRDKDFATEFGEWRGAHNYLQIRLNLINGDLRKAVPALQDDFDFVFHDPFSPRKVPELWTIDLFREYYRLLERLNGAVLTYSSAGAVRGGLQQAGFHVYKTTSVGAKPGGTLASVTKLEQLPNGVHVLSDDESAKLRGKSGIAYRDTDFSLARDDIQRARDAEQATYI